MTKKTNLLKKTSRTFLLTGLFLALLSTIALYIYTKNLLESEVEEVLYSTEVRITDALKKNNTIYSLPPVTEVIEIEALGKEVLKDTVIYDPSEDEMELFRELSTYKTINGKNYKITVRNMVVESEDFVLAIVISNIIIFGLAFIFLFYFNTARNLKLWSPFFKNLEQMKSFSLQSSQPLELVDSDVLEFSELKNEILSLTNKVKLDYKTLKQFTEDVSHEMQTPLAIIQAKIENIINDNTINDKQFEQITSIQKDIQRLKMLNKHLALLSKIDNNQFVNMENVDINKLIESIIVNFKELGANQIVFDSENELNIKMDPYLSEVLCNNLISNAIKHHSDNGEIIVRINENSLYVSNFGEESINHPEKLFLRFYRENISNQSTGLGLAIVKKICDFYGYTLTYSFKEHKHFFSVKFK